jgi:hypothetical protein
MCQLTVYAYIFERKKFLEKKIKFRFVSKKMFEVFRQDTYLSCVEAKMIEE